LLRNTDRRTIVNATVDKSLCMGCGLCPDICADVFEFEMDGDQAVVKASPVPAGAEGACREAAQQCPSEAIAIEED
jgi:ferredoxin